MEPEPPQSTMEQILESAKFFYDAKIIKMTPARDTINPQYNDDLGFVLAAYLQNGSGDDITEDLSYISIIASNAERSFDLGIPELLAFWMPTTLKFTTLSDDTVIELKITKAEKVTGKDGHNVDNRWGMFIHPRKDDSHYLKFGEVVAEKLAMVGIIIDPNSYKLLRYKVSKVSKSRTTFKFTYTPGFNRMLHTMRDYKSVKTKGTDNAMTIVLSRSFCKEFNLCPGCYGYNTMTDHGCTGCDNGGTGGKRKEPPVSASAYRARLMAKQARATAAPSGTPP